VNSPTDPLRPVPFHGLIGSGLIGLNAFDRRSWSGSSFHFFTECQRQGLLAGTSGAEAGGWRKLLLLALRFHPNKTTWRMRYYLDPRYRRLLTRALAPKIQALPAGQALLQIGGLFDAPAIAKGKRLCFSYHDGNLAMRLRSPFGAAGLSTRDNTRALAYERSLYQRIDRIFTMSEFLRRSFIEDFGIAEDRVISIGAGANLDHLPPANPAKDYGSGQILFIGMDFERKGGCELLQAFAKVRSQFPTAILHIVGPKNGPPANLPLDGVQWHGFLNKDVPEDASRLEALFHTSCVFVLPSLYEPFGIAPAEAMLHGIPAVVTGEWALAETVLDGKTGQHVKAGCVEHLASELHKLLIDPAKAQFMGNAARSHALERFTWQSVVRQLGRELELSACASTLATH
jgi:glycosyltransferase involved in cell wall biosynthesis